MIDDGYRFEESDDPRTWTGELIPDCEREPEVPFTEEELVDLPVIEYLGEFKALIDACGQVSYFFNMKKCIKAGVNKAKIVASAYQHDPSYYEEHLNDWRRKAYRSLGVLGLHAKAFGYIMPQGEEERKRFLNKLAVSEDRRKAYKGYLKTCLKNETTLSPDKLEKKYQQLLKKRLKKLEDEK